MWAVDNSTRIASRSIPDKYDEKSRLIRGRSCLAAFENQNSQNSRVTPLPHETNVVARQLWAIVARSDSLCKVPGAVHDLAEVAGSTALAGRWNFKIDPSVLVLLAGSFQIKI